MLAPSGQTRRFLPETKTAEQHRGESAVEALDTFGPYRYYIRHVFRHVGGFFSPTLCLTAGRLCCRPTFNFAGRSCNAPIRRPPLFTLRSLSFELHSRRRARRPTSTRLTASMRASVRRRQTWAPAWASAGLLRVWRLPCGAGLQVMKEGAFHPQSRLPSLSLSQTPYLTQPEGLHFPTGGVLHLYPSSFCTTTAAHVQARRHYPAQRRRSHMQARKHCPALRRRSHVQALRHCPALRRRSRSSLPATATDELWWVLAAALLAALLADACSCGGFIRRQLALVLPSLYRARS